MIDRKTRRTAGLLSIAAMIISLAGLTGCDSRQPRMMVVPVVGRDTAALEAEDVVAVMRRSGFCDAEILELGPDLRNALAGSGTAVVRLGEKVEAIFAVVGNLLHASTRRSGSLIYDLQRRSFM